MQADSSLDMMKTAWEQVLSLTLLDGESESIHRYTIHHSVQDIA